MNPGIVIKCLLMKKIAISVVFYSCLVCTTCQAAAGLPFTSEFETGDFSEWNGGQTASLNITTLDAYTGTYAARAEMTSGSTTDNYLDYYFGDHAVLGGIPPSNGLWLKFAFKFESGFNFGNASFHKMAIINYEDSTPRRRFQIIVNRQGSTGDFYLEHLKWNADRSFGACCPGLPQNVGMPVGPRIGQWDVVKLYIQSNTPGESDGIVRLWINNILKAEYINLSVRQDSTINPNKLILSNYVTTTEAAGAQLWDSIYLGEVDPDENDPAPKPPVLLDSN